MIRIKWCGFIRRTVKSIPMKQSVKWQEKTLRGRMDAVVCYNDQTAQLVIRALQEKGLRIPEDVSVTGYDNSSLADQQGLRLTTIDHPQEKLGAMAAELLLSMIQNGEKEEGESVLIQPMLIEGNSCMEYR